MVSFRSASTDIRNVSNWGGQFNANQEPILAFGIVP
jgi:hypothetical protein